ncbi:MAG: aminopeptidase P family protein [Chloroflexi bacterium CFX4]|nr:aminopeptidase P family protein [Chloroflexi bacterium CFX4]MDL1923547.1 aminopeptidase P family protein [Chloroflexi bacterium CFX3]
MTFPHAQARLDKLRGIVRRAQLDCVALIPGANLFYLSGAPFEAASRPLLLLVTPEETPALIIPALELPRIEGREPFPLRYFSYSDAEGYDSAFAAACQALNLAGKQIGVEGMKMRFAEGAALARHAPNSRVQAADDSLQWLRVHKSADEIALMQRAIAISEAALAQTLPHVRVGMTERHIAHLLTEALSANGAEAHAFEPLVLSGENTAQPHGSITGRAVREGDLLLFDFGAKVSGYAADITRTFVVGAPSPEISRIYETVLAANMAGIAAAKAGAPCQAVDRAARQVITEAGYGEYFIHRTGHGLGLDIHEPPYMREGNAQLLESGMTFTVEPGIYINGVGGVRIEDDVHITDEGAQVLTSFPKALQSIGA